MKETDIEKPCASAFRIGFTVILALFSSLVSCTMNSEVLKKRAEAAKDLGVAYFMEGDHTAALEHLLKAEKLNSDDPHVQNWLGLVFMTKGRPENAVSHLKRALEIKKGFAAARNNLGAAYAATRDWDSAMACFKDVLADVLYATPHYPMANIGWAYYKKKEYRLAKTWYLKALKAVPDFPAALRGLGRVYVATKECEKAVSVFNRIMELAPRGTMTEDAKRELFKSYAECFTHSPD